MPGQQSRQKAMEHMKSLFIGRFATPLSSTEGIDIPARPYPFQSNSVRLPSSWFEVVAIRSASHYAHIVDVAVRL